MLLFKKSFLQVLLISLGLSLTACQKAKMRRDVDRSGANRNNYHTKENERENENTGNEPDKTPEKNDDDKSNNNTTQPGTPGSGDVEASPVVKVNPPKVIVDTYNDTVQLKYNANILGTCGTVNNGTVVKQDCVVTGPIVNTPAPTPTPTAPSPTPTTPAVPETPVVPDQSQQQQPVVVDNSDKNPYQAAIYQPGPIDVINIIFVVSGQNLEGRLAEIGYATESLFRQIPANISYNATVIHAHDASDVAGRPYSSPSSGQPEDPGVWKSKPLTENGSDAASTIALAMANKMTSLNREGKNHGFYSLMRALSTNEQTLKDLGILSSKASLLVVFISSDDDFCSDINIANGALCNNVNKDNLVQSLFASTNAHIGVASLTNKSATPSYAALAKNPLLGVGAYDLSQDADSVMAQIGAQAAEKLSVPKLIRKIRVDSSKYGQINPNSLRAYVGPNSQTLREVKIESFDATTNTVTLSDPGQASGYVKISYDVYR